MLSPQAFRQSILMACQKSAREFRLNFYILRWKCKTETVLTLFFFFPMIVQSSRFLRNRNKWKNVFLKGKYMGGKEVISLYLSSLCSTAFVHSAFSLLTAFFFHLSPSFVTLPCNSFSGGFPQATRRLQKILFPFICIPFIWFFVLNISYILFTSASWFFFVCFYSAPRFLVWFFFFFLHLYDSLLFSENKCQNIRQWHFFNPGYIDRRFCRALTE